MEVLVLGSGGADGWPTPYCRCSSCLAARATGELRTPSSVLIDGRILLDVGPEAGRQALRAGVDLADLHTILVTHVHPDHCDPAALLYRGWATDAPLLVVGPQPVIEACRPWLDPAGSRVTLRAVTAGDRLVLPAADAGEGQHAHDRAQYVVRVLPADHHALGEAALYDVTGPAGERLLYATDTGPWPPAFAAMRAELTAYDLVLLEETFGDRPRDPGHHDLASFAAAVADLRAWGLVTDATRVLATHLSHHNPPPDQLAERLAAPGAAPARDLARIEVPQRSAGSDPPRPRR
ncbi:MAG: MBL fold metallo-hydrolase [Austwickia sp.]|nr:MAG: MBL fold metallo-hydrolase [Austwickia sp.]